MTKVQLLAQVLDRLGGAHLGKLARWNGVLGLNYHRIGAGAGSAYDRELFSATAEDFEEQMGFVARNFDVVAPEDLAGLRDTPRGRHVIVTFDDGYRDNFEIAFPILRSCGLQATFFVATGFLDGGHVAWWDEIAWMARRSSARVLSGAWLERELSLADEHRDATIRELLRRYKALPGERCEAFLLWLAEATDSGRCPPSAARETWMNWDMVREMRAAGMSIGGHTVHHPVLSRLSPAEQVAEILGAAERLRAELGEPMRWFSYPVGGRKAFDEHTRRALARAGVELAFSYYGGHRRPGDWDPYDVRRIAIERDLDGPLFRATMFLPELFGTSDVPSRRRLSAIARDLVSR